MDGVAGVEGREVLALVEVPQHGGAVLAAGRAQRAIGGDGHGVDVAGVANQVGLQLAVGEAPDLIGRASVGRGARVHRAHARSQRTLTILSQPAETMRGVCMLGEKRTQLTHSVWPSSVMVNLSWPSVFQRLMVLSREPDTI